MQIVCEPCQSKFNIADEKIPVGKVSSLRCPKCKNIITIDTRKPDPEPEPAPFAFDEASDDEAPEDGAREESFEDYDAEEKPFDFIEEEEKTALLCEPDAIIRGQITSVLNMLEYHVTVCESARDALKKMRYHIYNLVVLNEDFDAPDPESNGILIYLERLQMAVRRGVFVLLISTRHRTLDYMMSFNRSVNIIMNPKDITDFERILKRGLTEHDLNYRIYRETLKRLGRL
jgi:predicted Zn finger-like uncharacterized protein